MLMYATLLPHQKKGSQLTPQGIMPFAWDENQVNKQADIPTEGEVLAAKKRWEERDKKSKNKTVG